MSRSADPRRALILGLLLAPTAAARERCEPLDEPGLRDLMVQLRSGIDRGDEVLPAQVLTELHARIPCLTFAPTPRQWAEVLVGEAVVAFARGDAWEPAMSTALWIWPEVDRGVSSRHPLATWEPPPAPPPGPGITGRARLYVDGVPSSHLPPAAGAHLVQRTDGTWWNSIRVVDAPVPDGWAEDRVAPPPHLATGALVEVGALSGFTTQRTEWSSDWYLADDHRGAALSVAVAGRATFWSPFGLTVRAAASTWGDSPGADLHAAAIWTWRGVLLGGGFGTTTVDTFEGPEDEHRLHVLRYGLVTGELRLGRSGGWHTVAQYGGGPACTRGRLGLAAAVPADGEPGPWRVGLGGEFTQGRLAPTDAPSERLYTMTGRLALTLAYAWGELP